MQCNTCGSDINHNHLCGGSLGLSNNIHDMNSSLINREPIVNPIVAEELAYEEEKFRQESGIAFGSVIGKAACGDKWCMKLLQLAAKCAQHCEES